MAISKRAVVLWLMLIGLSVPAMAQRLINYTSGMGARSADNGNVWILYRGVRAEHEGMWLTSDSAHFDMAENSFEAFGNVAIELTDTTYIYGSYLFYDGNARVLNIEADTVILIDGRTVLLSDGLTYERPIATAYYAEWGVATSNNRRLSSRQGEYNVDTKVFYIYGDVDLSDSAMHLMSDTLVYNTVSKVAHFESPTHIFQAESTIYSELGDYNTDTRKAVSYKASHVDREGRSLEGDTLMYIEEAKFGQARGNVVLIDSLNNITCTGQYGEANYREHTSYVTDSALVLFVDGEDSLHLHADTVFVYLDSADAISAVRANFHVKVFRKDAQAMCDSAYYSASDSILYMYGHPVVWYEHYQCSADTLVVHHDSAGAKQAWLKGGCFAIQQVDREKYNQIKGRSGEVFFSKGNPVRADVVGNAQMTYYITEEGAEGKAALVGVNAGVGSEIRIYFDEKRAPQRVVTLDNPDMRTYPVGKEPEEVRRMQGFDWRSADRPRAPHEVFKW